MNAKTINLLLYINTNLSIILLQKQVFDTRTLQNTPEHTLLIPLSKLLSSRYDLPNSK